MNRILNFYVLVLIVICPRLYAQISIPNGSFTHSENFNTLSNTGTSSTVPAGIAFIEAGANQNLLYTAGTGSSNSGDTYSFGLAANTERAFGGLQSGSLIPSIGVCYTNNTGATINAVTITYTGETWRVGAANRTDGIQFQYNQNTTAINGAGTWTSFPALDYFNPGQATGSGSMLHSALVTSTITGLSIPNGTTFCFRWNDFNATGSDDGIGLDDYSFSFTLEPLTPGVTVTETNGSTNISEAGLMDSIFYVLNSQPSNDVILTLTPDAQSTLSLTQLTFTPANWNIPQFTKLTAVDDAIVEGNHTSTITHSVVSSDANYNGLTLPNVIANITDNDFSPTVSLTCPGSTTLPACQTQAQVNTAFTNWLNSAVGTGGCDGILTYGNPSAPSFCGGFTVVTFTYTSTCAPFTTTCQDTFFVTSAPAVSLICPQNTTAPICLDQTQLAANYTAWLNSALGSGGCNGSLTNSSTGVPPITGGSTTVTFTYTSSCAPSTTSCQATYTVPTQQAPANAGPDQNVCFGPVTLAAIGSGAWSGGLGTFSSTTSPTAIYTPAASEQGTTVNLTWTISTQCGPSTDQVSLTIAPNQAIITYPSIACTGGSSVSPILGSGSMNGVYSYTGAGTLSINTNSGVINPALSTSGTYIITNTFTPPIGTGPSLMLLGVIDAPLTGGIPKAIKLVALNNIPDMSIYGLENTSNGAASAGTPDFVFPSGAVTAGTIIWVASEATAFNTWFGFAPTYINTVANNNGDDGILLYANGVVTDAYGVPGVTPPLTGSWNYLDGWAHRKPSKCPSVVFNLSDWDLSGANALDDDALNTNATSSPPFPAGTYTATSCAPTTSCTSIDTARITIRLSPSPNTGGGRVICGAVPTTITATGGSGTWAGGAGSFSTTTGATTTYTPNSNEVGNLVKLTYSITDPICGAAVDTFRLSILPLPKSAEFSYSDTLFCPNGINPTVSHVTGVDGIYKGNSPNIKVDSLTGEINLAQTSIGTYTVTNTVYACGNLMITGIIDGNLPGGQPKAIELYALEDIRNLSEYGLGIVNNGGVSNGQEYTFPAQFVKKGTFLYAANNAVDFNTFFGFQANFVVNQLQINGDDLVEVYCSGQLIDQFGVSNQDGTGTAWEYMDGWAYRKNNANIVGAGFVPSAWNYSGINALDPATSNANAVPPFPIRSFTTNASPICPPNVFSRRVTINDTTPPTITCPSTLTVNLSPGFCGDFVQLPLPTITDNCPGNITITQTAGPLSGSFFTKFDSPYTITYSATDVIGNGPVTCSFQVLVVEYPNPISALACEDLVNISVDENCQLTVGADMILAGGPYGCYDEYIVSVSGHSSNIVSKLGTYTVTVTDPETGNSCWGTIKVEDKLPPVFECGDFTVRCIDPISATPVPPFNASKLPMLTEPIPFEGGPVSNAVVSTITIPEYVTCKVTDLDVLVNVTDDWMGDLNVTVVSPAGTTSTVWGNFCGFTPPGLFFVADDEGTNSNLCVDYQSGANLMLPGLVPNPPFTAFDGQDVKGTWSVRVWDQFDDAGVDGIVNAIELRFAGCSAPGFFPKGTCGEDFAWTYSDNVSNNGCDGDVITRTWTAKDAVGNAGTCVQKITVENITLADVSLPPSLIEMNSCGTGITPADVAAFFDIDSRTGSGIGGYNDDYTEASGSPVGVVELNEGYAYGYPHYFAVGRDGNLHAQKIDNNVCSIYATYTDQILSACGTGCVGNSKVIRTWTLLDWCTLEQATYVQVIKAVDQKAPTFIVKDITVSVNPWGCVANFDAPMPWELADNCDAHPKWWLEGPAGVVITGNSTDGYKVTGAPKGVHNFTYKAIDCCGNIGTAVAVVTVIDRSAPVAVAKQNIVISLTGSGTGSDGAAKLYTNSVDNGSYDHCTDIKLELRRPDGSPSCGNLGIDDHNNNVTFNNDENFSPGASWKHPEDDKDDTDNGAFVKFCCEDLAGTESAVHQVIMRVWDDGNMNGIIGDNLIIDGMQDNYNETWADVRVENKLAPVIVCPVDATVTCDMELNISTVWRDVEEVVLVTGEATAYDLCNGIKVEYKDTPTWTNTCENVGRIRREFRAVKGTKTVNCYQTITVGAIASTFVVTPPSNSILDAPCDFDKTKIKASDKPKVQSGACDVIGENILIEEFLFEDGVCKKWRVTYSYVNWCTNEQKGPYVKYYKYKDEVKPVLTCQDQMFAANPNPQNPLGGCEGTVNLEASATDEGGCIAGGWLKWTVIVDLWGNGTDDYEFTSFLPTTDNNLGNDTNGNGIADRYVAPTSDGQVLKVPAFVLDAEMSTHKVFWKVTDGCGNVTSCNSTFMVVDKKAPTPYCVSLSSALMTNCQVELWAIDFNKGSFDNCTPQNGLLYTFNGEMPVWEKLGVEHFFKGAGVEATAAEYNAGNAQRWVPAYKSSARIFNKAGTIDVNMSVWDGKGNTDFCKVTLTLVDNTGGCGTASTCNESAYTGMSVATCFALKGSGEPVGVIYDTRNYCSAPKGKDWTGATAIHPASWREDVIGQVYGITMDGNDNVYLASSDVYGYDYAPPSGYTRGQIFKASPPSFTATAFVSLPVTKSLLNGIGNIVYDKANNQMFATNLEDGKIYRISSNGTILDTYDPFNADNGISGIAEQAEQLWGIGLQGNKLYFARISISERSIYSLSLTSGGNFPSSGSEIKAIQNVPGVTPKITDITFSKDGTQMLMAERGGAHDSKVMMYTNSNGAWQFTRYYYVGAGIGENTAGGVAFAHTGSQSCGDKIFATGNYMAAGILNVDSLLLYGIEGINVSGNKVYSEADNNGNNKTDIFIDFDGIYLNADGSLSTDQKYQIGDVEVFQCKQSTQQMMSIAGSLKTQSEEGIENVSVKLQSTAASMDKNVMSSHEGTYMFGQLPTMVDFSIKGVKRDDWLNGVSTLDLVLIQRHILGISKFNNGYKMIAADVNNDEKVTASDLVALRKVILGISTEFPNNDSWRFINAQTGITNPTAPWPLDEEIKISGIDYDMLDMKFTGVKVGDVNLDAVASFGNPSDNRTSNSLRLEAEDKEVKAGEVVTMDVTSSNFAEIFGYQFTAKMSGAEVLDVKSGAINVEESYGMPSANTLTMSYASDKAVNVANGEVLFTIVLKAKESGRLSNMIAVGSDVTRSESYAGAEMTTNKLEMNFRTNGEVVDGYALYQNEPNPFKTTTVVSFNMPSAARATITMTDVTGKVVNVKGIDAVKGMNKVEFNRNDVPASGVVYYTVSSGEFTATKAMIVIE